MKNHIIKGKIAILVVALGTIHLSCRKKSETDKAPRLTILIGIDEFRADRLHLYKDYFSGGLKRILDNGAWFQNSRVAHAPALSFPGHATLGTGTDPRVHGITANSWIDMSTLDPLIDTIQLTRAHQDFKERTIGDSLLTALSPKKLKVPTIADWFERNNPESKTVALSTGSAAIYYGSTNFSEKKDKHVYWLGTNGQFVTSSYYRESYPQWLNQFNETMWENYVKYSTWDLTVTEDQKKSVRNDSVDYEFDGVYTFFPHKAENMMTDYNPANHKSWFKTYSPYQNLALFDLAKTSIKALVLGYDDNVDFLGISLDLPDAVVHRFGPMSLELLDVMLRLDKVLGDFLSFLDNELGEGNYLIAISADHGSPNITEYEVSQGRESIRITSDDFKMALNAADSITNNCSKCEDLPKVLATKLERFPFIVKAMTPNELTDSAYSGDSILEAYKLAYLPSQPTTYPLWTKDNRYGNLVTKSHPASQGVIVEIPFNSNIWPANSTHGGAHDYDRNVPVLLYGTGISATISKERIFTRDVAPTLANLSGVEIKGLVNGKVVTQK